MIYDIHLHPNFKFVVKNRQMLKAYNIVVKNSEGIEIGPTGNVTQSRWGGTRNSESKRFEVFECAEKYNAKVFLLTQTNRIELHEKDFR